MGRALAQPLTYLSISWASPRAPGLSLGRCGDRQSWRGKRRGRVRATGWVPKGLSRSDSVIPKVSGQASQCSAAGPPPFRW